MSDFFNNLNNFLLITFQLGTMTIINSLNNANIYMKNIDYNELGLKVILLYSQLVEVLKTNWIAFYRFQIGRAHV